MAKSGGSSVKKALNTGPKKTRQGKSPNTKLSATPSNKARKAYRGQGK